MRVCESGQTLNCPRLSLPVVPLTTFTTSETFNDPEMRKRLLELNPNSFRQIVGTLLEVHGRGYWETSDENIEQLQELYQGRIVSRV